MERPLLYLSKFFEEHKNTYYDNLMRVREKDDMNRWLRFFLIGVRDTSTEAADTIRNVIKLKNDLENKIRAEWGRRTRSALILLEHLFKQPAVDIKAAENVCDLSARTAGKLVDSFESAGILDEITGQRRNRMYLFRPYLKLFK